MLNSSATKIKLRQAETKTSIDNEKQRNQTFRETMQFKETLSRAESLRLKKTCSEFLSKPLTSWSALVCLFLPCRLSRLHRRCRRRHSWWLRRCRSELAPSAACAPTAPICSTTKPRLEVLSFYRQQRVLNSTSMSSCIVNFQCSATASNFFDLEDLALLAQVTLHSWSRVTFQLGQGSGVGDPKLSWLEKRFEYDSGHKKKKKRKKNLLSASNSDPGAQAGRQADRNTHTHAHTHSDFTKPAAETTSDEPRAWKRTHTSWRRASGTGRCIPRNAVATRRLCLCRKCWWVSESSCNGRAIWVSMLFATKFIASDSWCQVLA